MTHTWMDRIRLSPQNIDRTGLTKPNEIEPILTDIEFET